jgi:hypothetical protein
MQMKKLKCDWKCLICRKPIQAAMCLSDGKILYHICQPCEKEAIKRIKKAR